MNKTITITLALIAASFIGVIIIFNIQQTERTTLAPHVKINGQIIKVLIADEPAELTQGLSDRPYLEADQGMLFVFPDSQVRSFWMKNMHFPLDIIWIDDNNIINISQNLPPEGEQPQNHYSSVLPVNYVLEVIAGFAAENEIVVGDEVMINIQ